MAATDPKAGPFDETYSSLPVYWPVRWRLRWTARRDRRAGLPVGLDAGTTPVLRDLLARRDDACEQERTRYVADIRAIDVRLAEIDSRLTALQRTLAVRTEEAVRASVRPSEQELTRRTPGERDLPADVVRERRATEHRRTAQVAKSAQLEAQLALDAALAEEAQLEARRRIRADVARSRVLGLVERADRLAAIYRRALLRRHPQREALLRSWAGTLVVPPAWVLPDDVTSAPGR